MRLHLAHSGIFFRFGRLTEFPAGKSCKIYMRIFSRLSAWRAEIRIFQRDFRNFCSFRASKNGMKTNAVFSACASAAVFALSGCLSYDDSPTTHWNAHSQAGIPVKTRLRGDDSGFRFFFIGTSPSEQAAIDNLYAAAEREGYKIDGSPYAFQNMYSECSGFLYPFIGYGYLTVWADLYKYEYKGTDYSVRELGNPAAAEKTTFSIFNSLFK